MIGLQRISCLSRSRFLVELHGADPHRSTFEFQMDSGGGVEFLRVPPEFYALMAEHGSTDFKPLLEAVCAFYRAVRLVPQSILEP